MRKLTPERWRQIDEIFAEALDLPLEDREALLRARCGNDAVLRAEVEHLLSTIEVARDALGESVSDFAEPLVEDLRATLEREELASLPGGGRIGSYRLIEVIGRGGMGAVYLAERADEQFEKRVALKLVKRGMDTDEVLQRFRYERQILAGLEHPNIARLYDGGAAEDGRPYLVMEHIDGEPVTTYCDARRLSIEARLRIFETICAAVEHAHRNLVIHRDLKPSNILVTADGTVKLLDFGIAKLLDPSHPEQVPRTRTEMRLLTPEYASPEQIDGAPVTTATDVYSLGVILFELLTGRRPSEERGRRTADRLGLDTGRGRPSSSVVRPLRVEEPGEEPVPAAEIAARRGTTPERLRARLRGDLDTITLKALAEEPERRYPSAEQLLADVQRYRRGLPVLARGESFGYRTTKFVRRHRVVASFSAALLVVLFGFVSTVFLQNQRLEAARAVAEDRQAQAEGLIGYMLDDLHPKLASLGRSDLLVEALTKAGEYFMAVSPEQLSDQELLRRTKQMRMLGDVRLQRGDDEGALSSFRDAHALSSSLLARDSTNADWRLGLATDHFYLGSINWRRGELEEALEHFQSYRDHVARLVEYHPDNPTYQLELSYALGNIGTVLDQMGDRDGAIAYLLETLDLKKDLAEAEPENPEYQSALAIAYNKVAVAEQQRGDLLPALEHHRAELAVRKALVEARPNDMPARSDLSLAHSFLGELLLATGDAAGALEQWTAAWAISRELVRWDSANVSWQRGLATSARLAGRGFAAAGRPSDGLAALGESRDILRQLLSRDPASADYRQEMAATETALARVLVDSRPADAEAAARRAVQAVAPRAFEENRPAFIRGLESGAHLELGRALWAQGRETEARREWRRALDNLGSEDSAAVISHLALRANLLLHLGRTEEAGDLVNTLISIGYRSPEFLALARRAGVPPADSR